MQSYQKKKGFMHACSFCCFFALFFFEKLISKIQTDDYALFHSIKKNNSKKPYKKPVQ